MNHEEDAIQAAICLALSEAGIYFFSVPNSAGGKTSMQRAMRLKATGLRAGVADLVVMRQDGRACFLEVKTKTGRLSPAQDNFKILCAARGWSWGIARSVDDALALCVAWEVLP